MAATDSSAAPLVLDFLRHGEPLGGNRYRGSLDDPLSDLGWDQMHRSTTAAIDAGHAWQAVITSPLSRCRAFAERFSEEQQLPLTIAQDFREIGFGDLEGMPPDKAWLHHRELLLNLWQDPERHTPPNGEAYPAFAARVAQELHAVRAHYPSGNLLVVAHGGVIRSILCTLIGLRPANSFQLEIPHAGLSRVTLYPAADDEGVPFHASVAFLNRYSGTS